ncbi:MAG TPA: aminotransferase class III-fold pyridoxal phosphate-dependent enzyme [Solirubrobacterales bacterium]|nr:aminotransferase class III-fold pyridoxal phosphate-dependent enzyme [Solirubrobacterales bacterium]
MGVEITRTGTTAIDRDRIAELTRVEMDKLKQRTPASRERWEQASKVMPGGVPSSFQSIEPWPVFIERGEGSRVWDVDGNEYSDFHNGFGVVVVGHGNPHVTAAVQAQAARGTHFAAPTQGSITVAEELRRRFKLPQWRFTNSGTESTMDAVHLARAATGRDMILKIEGSYHGHHDAVMVSVYPELEELGDRDDPRSVVYGAGYPKALTDLTRAVPFNDAEALGSVLGKLEGRIAGMILEPAMMNINIIPPVVGYLERVRELCTEHGVKLIFDEVKTGCTIAPGGATERFGVDADMVTLAKATFGGYPGGAIGMTDELAELVSSGEYHQYGTFNGNPLVMAASEATLLEALTPDAYEKLEATNDRLLSGSRELIDGYGLPCYPEGMGAKGCVIFSSEPLREYRDYLSKVDRELATLAWLYHMNHGIFMTPGVEEEWTLSVAHSDDDVQRYLDALEAFARDVTGS